MSVKNHFCGAVAIGLCAAVVISMPRTAAAEGLKLRYGFQADREYPYQIAIHAKVVDDKIDRQGELIYKVLSAKEDRVVLKTSGSAVTQLGQVGGVPFRHFGPPFMHRARKGPP